MAPPPYAEEDPNKHMETSTDGAPRETQTNAPQSREIYPNISHAGRSQPSTSQIGQIQPHTSQSNEMSPYTSENEQSQLNISQSREICINTSQAGAAQSDASQGEVTQTITSQLGGQELNTCQREDTQFSRFQRNEADWSRWSYEYLSLLLPVCLQPSLLSSCRLCNCSTVWQWILLLSKLQSLWTMTETLFKNNLRVLVSVLYIELYHVIWRANVTVIINLLLPSSC